MRRFAALLRPAAAVRAARPAVRWYSVQPPGASDLQRIGRASTVTDLFHRYDTSGDGLLQEDEMQQLLQSQGCVMSIEQVRTLIASIDADGDGCVSLSELEAFLYPVDMEGGDESEGAASVPSTDEQRERAALG
eukprot:TRINITY_DN8243_c0_g2_i1.p5 TRINITY_DN8243_c0_g2~~TRINITY_DN8243_c0_g2_i1.p5  ORF type:complete len:134 (+),score=55.82 TRINITY_DN8243_c0_g2_i1:108-509(+)